MSAANPGLDKINFEDEIRELQNNEPLNSLQFVAQVSLLLFCTVTAWLILDLWELPVWFVVYYTLLSIEKYAISRLPKIISARNFVSVLIFLAFNASIFVFMPVFLWFQGSEILKFGTLALVTGFTLNSFLTRARYPSILACYLIPNAFVFLAISFGVFREQGLSDEFLETAIITIAIATYFLICLLEAHKKVRTAAIFQDQLQHSQRAEVIGRLTGAISHDFNNLLSVISGSLQLLREPMDEQERSRLIEQAVIALEHGSDLTKQMLALGRQAPLMPKAVDTDEALLTISSFLLRQLPESINLATEVAPDTSWMQVDPGMFQSAVINLALNAKASMPNGGSLTIRARNVRKPPKNGLTLSHGIGFVEIMVEDTGSGISIDDLRLAFEPFYTTQDVGDGTGLGLPMVKGFVEQSEGQIELDSTVGEGTKVSLFLPISVPEAPIALPDKSSVRVPVRTSRILVVDDNQQLLELITLKLRRIGYEVWPYKSGDEAASVVEHGERPDLLLTDVVMKGEIQGPDLAQLVRKRFPGIPVIMMSGYAEARSRPTNRFAQANLFIEKPLQLGDLSDKIAELLK